MIAETGHFLLIVATLTALVIPAAALIGVYRDNAFLADLYKAGQWVVSGGLLGASACLVWAFLTDDFSVAYVANHSNSQLETLYKFAAFWGSHEGSLLLWVLLLALWGSVVGCVVFEDKRLKALIVSIQMWITAGLSLFLITTSNPFIRNLPKVPYEGRDLNPVLQDIGMILHPPLLFMGYAGLSLIFATVLAVLIRGALSAQACRLLRTQTAAVWLFLTAGNALGSWWAYTELGWGGWWFWDPVENASFIPWLVTTGVLHALIWLDYRRQWARLVMLLSLTGFALCLLGSFIVRSGVVQSVHAFASDPNKGVMLLILSAVFLIPAVVVYLCRIDRVCAQESGTMSVADIVMLAGVLLLASSGFCVLLGTVYPLIYDTLGLGKLTVGAPYFNAFFAPMAVLAALMMGILQLGVRRESMKPAVLCAIAAAGIAAGCVALTQPKDSLMTALGLWAAAWIALTLCCCRFTQHRMPTLALILAHAGVAVSMIGATVVSNYETEELLRMGPGLGKEIGAYVFVYTDTEDVVEHGYFAKQARIEVLDRESEDLITVLRPQRQTFRSNGMQMTAAGIRHGIWEDLYVSMGNAFANGDWLIRICIKPMVNWLWGGAALMLLAAGLIIFRKRRTK